MTDTYFQLRYIQTSSRNAVNKKLFLTSLLFLAHSYCDVQHTNFQMSLKIKIVRQWHKQMCHILLGQKKIYVRLLSHVQKI
jgi:hypothetical protein